MRVVSWPTTYLQTWRPCLHGWTSQRGCFISRYWPGSTTATDDTTENGNEEKPTNTTGEANDEGLVVIDPINYLAKRGRTATLSLGKGSA